MIQTEDLDLEGEARDCEVVIRRLAPLTQQVMRELSCEDADRVSTPVRVGNWWYFLRKHSSASSSQMYRFPVDNLGSWTPPDPLAADDVQTVLDFDADKPVPGATLGARAVSPDSRLLAWTYDPSGDERFVAVIRDLDLGSDRIVARDVGKNVAWSPASDAVFTTSLDAQWRPYRVSRNPLDPLDGEGPTLCYEEPDESFAVRVSLTRSGQCVLVHSASDDTSEVLLVHPGHTAVLVPRRQGRLCAADHVVRSDGRSEFLALHNGLSDSFSFARVPSPAMVGSTTPWDELGIPDSGVRLTHVIPFSTFDLLVGTRGPDPVYFTRSCDDNRVQEIDATRISGSAVSLTLGQNESGEQPYVRFHASSFSRPPFNVDYVPADKELLDRGTSSGQPSPVAVSERTVWATGVDDQRVPVTVLSSGDDQCGPRPTVLLGYGAYGLAIRSMYDPTRMPYLSRGFVYAIAHVRGGGEFGPSWHSQGCGLNKPVAVSDFLACAQALVDAGISERGQILATGASAGGTLVAAALNRDPEMFAGVLATVPFVDPLGSMLDPSLPFTVRDRAEWGDPVHDPAALACLESYSPVQNVSAAPYPTVWCSAAVNDVRVPLSGPLQWVRRLRECGTSGGQVHFRVSEDSGHQSAVGHVKETSLETAWAIDVLSAARV